MKFQILLTLFFLTASTIYGQSLSATQDYRRVKDQEYDLRTFKGSPYLDEEFKLGIIKDKLTGKEIKAYLRYDAYSDVFQRKASITSSVHTFLEKTAGVKITYDNRSYMLTDYKDRSGRQIIGYLEYLGIYESNSFYVKHGKMLRLPEKAPNPQVPDKAGKISDDFYYVLSNTSGKRTFEITKRNIYDIFTAEDKGNIKNIIKKNKLKFKDPLDLQILLKLLNKK